MIKNQFSKNKIFITGATGYIGRCLANRFAKMGGELILTDLDLIKLKKLKKELQSNYNIKVYIKECDLGKISSIKNLNNWVLKNFSKIDNFIHNAANTGISKNVDRSKNFKKQKSSYWEESININVKSSFEIIKSIYKIMQKSKNPSIVHVSSIYGIIAPDWKIYKNTNLVNPAVYSVSKSGLNQFTKWLASYLSPKIRVNSVSPGGVFRGQNKKFVKRYISKTLLKRMATEEDVVNSIIFLCSDMSNYITGHNLIVDGGYTLT